MAALADDQTFDVVVLGAGGAGMSAAVYAAIDGARVLLVESTAYVGGTTATSAGTTWVPGTRLAPEVNPQDTLAEAETFLDHAVGARADRALRQAFLQHGAAAVAKISDHSHLKYRIRPFHPDYLSELPGATSCGRALEPLPFDGRRLGAHFGLVRPPIPEFMVLGGMMADRDDIPHLLGWHRSWTSATHVARLLLRHLTDRLRHPRGTRLLMGNALIGRLLLSCKERGVTVLTGTEARALHRNAHGVVDGLTLSSTCPQTGTPVTRRLRVKGGVILASGGFNRHPQRRAALLGTPDDWCPGGPGHRGSALDLAEAAGATWGASGPVALQADARQAATDQPLSPCFWAPVSRRTRADGSVAVFPHFVFDRAKPHMVTVNARGERFLNESTSYHLFGLAMLAAHPQPPGEPTWLITDAQGMAKYGLGMVRPKGMGLASALADGYVTRGASVADLAARLQLPAATLQGTLNQLKRYAADGVDPDFGRGTTLYQRANGDAGWPGPNPSLGPIEQPPFYAVRLHPGDIGAAMGLRTDASARTLDAAGQPIPGLYAVGNDMQSIMGGVYPAPGITLGPGLVFAYLAAGDAVRRSRSATD
ncbi:FAD-dependent oxidoreductase [Ideonella sp. TBM-1]|uniref:FAD-dependent oxidoreductase n=1 Tax=Ideonella livida TaxID=2707176 RepID=A0A7C9TNU0_9BURK|nr:FAD-dependent oxidoreductase [Ideonella livida]